MNAPAYTRFGAGPPLLFVSGLFQSRQNWESFMSPLAGSFEVIVSDFPSPAPGASGAESAIAGPEFLEDQVLALLDSLSLAPRDVNACGMSFGASLLRSLHLRRGVDFKRLVLLSVNCPQLQTLYRQFDRAMLDVLDRGGPTAYAAILPFWLFSRKWLADNPIVHDVIRSRYEAMLGGGDEMRTLMRAASADVERGVPEGRFRCGTVMIHGDEDALTPAKYVQAYAASSGALFCGMEGGHGFLAENPPRALESLRRVLADGE